MWKPIYQPDSWPVFLKREDNIGLPLMEVRQKYLKEQLEFDNFISQQNSILRGRANKTELVSYDYGAIEGYTGLERYRDYPSCSPPSLDIFAQDFGPTYVDRIEDGPTSNIKNVFFTPEGSLTQTGIVGIQIDIISYNLSRYGGVNWTLEVIPEYQGRENVLKMYIPPGLAVQSSVVNISPLVGTGPNRPDFVDTHTFSLGMGMWNEGFSWNSDYKSNSIKSTAGSGDLILFLSSLTPTNPDQIFGRGVSWEGDQWNDLRSEEELIAVQNSPAYNNFVPGYTNASLTSELRALDPQTLYGPEHTWYFSDFNFRVCPL